MKAAEDIFMDSQYLRLVKELQKNDFDNSFENSTLPEEYTSRGEPKTQSGRNMGLKVSISPTFYKHFLYKSVLGNFSLL